MAIRNQRNFDKGKYIYIRVSTSINGYDHETGFTFTAKQLKEMSDECRSLTPESRAEMLETIQLIAGNFIHKAENNNHLTNEERELYRASIASWIFVLQQNHRFICAFLGNSEASVVNQYQSSF